MVILKTVFFSSLGHALINLDSILELHMVLTCSDSQTGNWLSDDGKKGRKFQLVCALCGHKFSKIEIRLFTEEEKIVFNAGLTSIQCGTTSLYFEIKHNLPQKEKKRRKPSKRLSHVSQ